MRKSKKHTPSVIFKYRKGLATIVTSAILLSSVSILGAAMLGWSQTSINSQKQEMEDVFTTQVNKLGEDLVFDNVWFSTTCSYPGPLSCLNVTVSNVGTLGLNVTEIKLINGTTLENLQTFYYSDGGIAISNTLSTNVTYAWPSGGDFDITVFTERGNQFTTQEIAP